MVYGPTIEAMRQQQKLRAYYNFIDVDTVRYEVDGEKKMLASAIREVPLMEPAPWLAWWGQMFMLFTHGHGLVTLGAGDVSVEGNPVYVSSGVPVSSRVSALQDYNQKVYYGEGAGSMAYSNVKGVAELDFPTDEGRATTRFPADVDVGVKLDSFLKRLVFGYKSGQFFEIVFSDLIVDDTRVHFFRTPIQRVERIAPFLHLDGDPYAVAADGELYWLVNGIAYTDRYPMSTYTLLGDKSDVRGEPKLPVSERLVNYAADAVKITVNAYTGAVKLYLINPDPIGETIRSIYPDIFTDPKTMPAGIRKQLQYPTDLMHVQFDDLYIYYQMTDPMTFFNMEDMWDDGDEVLGPVLASGKAVRFSIEPFDVILEPGSGSLPASSEKTQFSKVMIFTPEKALNLRSLPFVYQDGEDYGKIYCLQVPKGHYSLGPVGGLTQRRPGPQASGSGSRFCIARTPRPRSKPAAT